MPGDRRVFHHFRQDLGALWILLLVFLAGLLNAAGFLRFGQTMSHMTGNLTKLSLSLSGIGGEMALLFAVCLCSFFLGATVSGFSFPTHRAGLWQRSGLVLLLGGLLLVLCQAFAASAFVNLAALALVSGAQNGLALRFRGILTRTTHMTGHLTDCGAALGRMLAARRFLGEDLRLFLFHLSCLVFFALGVLFCALLKDSLGMDMLLFGGLCYLFSGFFTLLRAAWARRAV